MRAIHNIVLAGLVAGSMSAVELLGAANGQPAAAQSAFIFPHGGLVTTHADGSRTEYRAAQDTDEARGKVLMEAVAAARDGDHLDLSEGVFHIGTASIIQARTNGGAFHLHGSGKNKTVIERASGPNAIVVPCNNAQTTDLTLYANDPKSTMSGWGNFGATTSITNAWLQNVCISNWTDGILFGGNVTIAANVIDVYIFSRWDGVYFADTARDSVGNFYRTECIATADRAAADSQGQARCYAITGGTLKLYGCSGIATDSPGVREHAYAVQTGVGRYAPGRAFLYGGTYTARAPQGMTSLPNKEIDLYSGGSAARIHVSPSVKYASYGDVIIPQPHGTPLKIAEVQWEVPKLPPRTHPKPKITRRSEKEN